MATDEELSRESNVHCDIGVHGMLAEHIYSELVTSLGEPEEAVKGQDVGEYAAPLIMMNKFKEAASKCVVFIRVRVF